MFTSLPVFMATTTPSLPFSLLKLKPPSLTPSLFRRTLFPNSTPNAAAAPLNAPFRRPPLSLSAASH